MKTRPMSRSPARTVVALVCAWSLQWSSLAVAADLSQDMAQMFQDVGAVANVTGPGAYRSQTMNIYTGGELQMRMPVRNYQLWSLTLPSIKAGCGGIDAYMGSFSHINGEQFKAMLQQIGANTIGVLFKAALKSINPLIESTIGDLQKSLEFLNSMNVNSCQAAAALVNGVMGAMDINSNSACVSMARAVYGDDEAAARSRCQSAPETVNADTKANADPEVKELAQRDLNLVWEALSRSSFSADEKETFMNIAGTFIFKKPLNNGGTPEMPRFIGPSIDSLATLLNGNQPGSNADRVQIGGWWSCTDVDCLSPTQGLKEVTPFPVLVRNKLISIHDKMVNRQALDASDQLFVSMVTVPVYRMLTIGYASGDTGEISDMLIDRYAGIIAYDYAYTYLSRMLREVTVYAGQAKLQSQIEDEKGTELRRRVDSMKEQIALERQNAQSRIQNMNAMVDDLMRIERQMQGGMPPALKNMQQFSNLITGKS